MKYFILIFIIFFSITLFGQRSGGRIGGSSFDNESSSSYSSSGTSSNNSGSLGYSTGTSYSQTNSNSFFGNDSSSSGFTESTKEATATDYLIALLFIVTFVIVSVIVFNWNTIKYKYEDIRFYFISQKKKYTTLKIQFAFHATIYNLRKEFVEFAEKLNFTEKESLMKLIEKFVDFTEQNNSYIKYGDLMSETDTDSNVMAKITHNAFIQLELKNLNEETYLKIQNHKSLVKQLKEENKPEFTEIKEYIIFTLIVTCKNLKIEKKDDYSYQYYSTILQQLKNIDFPLIQAVDVIWTPDAENDVLTEDDIIQNYNNLKTV